MKYRRSDLLITRGYDYVETPSGTLAVVVGNELVGAGTIGVNSENVWLKPSKVASLIVASEERQHLPMRLAEDWAIEAMQELESVAYTALVEHEVEVEIVPSPGGVRVRLQVPCPNKYPLPHPDMLITADNSLEDIVWRTVDAISRLKPNTYIRLGS